VLYQYGYLLNSFFLSCSNYGCVAISDVFFVTYMIFATSKRCIEFLHHKHK